MSLAEDIARLRDSALESLSAVRTPEALEAWRVRYLGRKGELQALFGQLGAQPEEERRLSGQAANQAKTELSAALEAASQRLKSSGRGDGVAVDTTLPGIVPVVGGLHITRQTLYDIARIFAGMGFGVYESNEVETDEYNFQLLNLPPDHPARDAHDTFYITDDLLLRTHTSPGQIRYMREHCPEPIRAIFPGKCHRYEALDASHESMFYQVEGLAVGNGITLANLKGVLEAFAQQMYGEERRVRFRGSYFPFTEPSVEFDILCVCLGDGCPVCKGKGWLEIGGAGMVHPVVLENGGYDSREVSGFAFGFGPERIAMPGRGIDDIRYFYGNDLRFLRQFT